MAKSPVTPPAVSPWIRPALTPFKASLPSSSPGSTAVTSTWWACPSHCCTVTSTQSDSHGILGSMPIENPFQDPLRFERRVPECAVVIFGANGDLTKRKLIPALYRLAYDRRLSAGFAIVGISRTPRTDDHTSELQSLRHLVCRLLLEK